jgi:hypothetical protein
VRECPRRRGWRYLDPENGWDAISFLPKCGSVSCPVCIGTEVWKWGRVIGEASPSRFGVVTGLHDTWDENRLAFKNLFRRLDRHGYALRAFYCVEVNPRETGHHGNIWWWGPDVPHEEFVAAAVSVGWKPRVSLSRWKSRDVDRYGMKEITYGMKETLSSVGEDFYRANSVSGPAADYLANNGGRLMHARAGRNSPYRLGVRGQEFSSRREFWAAIRDAYDGERRKAWAGSQSEAVLTWENGHIAGSRDLPAPSRHAGSARAWATPPAPTGPLVSAWELLPGL